MEDHHSGNFSTLTATSGILWDHYVLLIVLPLLGVLARGQGWVLYLIPICAVFAFPPLAAWDSERWLPWAAFTALVGSVLALCLAEFCATNPGQNASPFIYLFGFHARLATKTVARPHAVARPHSESLKEVQCPES